MKDNSSSPVVAILDAGAQYVDMIKKACERQGYPAQALPIDTPFAEIKGNYKAIIVSGGPASSHQDQAPMPDTEIWQQDTIPTFNICYGMQALALHLGGQVSTRGYRSDGRQLTTIDDSHPLFDGIRRQTTALFTHGDFVDQLPPNVDVIGEHTSQSGEQIISAIASGKHVAVQFHPEIYDDTPQGHEIFGNFFRNIAKLDPDQDYIDQQMQNMIDDKQQLCRDRISDKHVIAFVSGGVDSSVAAALINDIVDPDKLHMYYIDNGYMRDEDDDIIARLQAAGLNVEKIEAQDQFEQAMAVIDGQRVGPLIDVVNPVHKRRIIGEAFVDVQDEIVAKLGLKQEDVVLLQGTNAADRIESGHSTSNGQATEQIKEHHNQVKRVRDLNPLEPLDDLFKDEIRALAQALGLPEDLARRHPFPGPGTAIRILGLEEGGVTIRSDDHQLAVQNAISEMNSQLETDFKGLLLPVRSVGVGGDSRSHIEAVAIDGAANAKQLQKIASSLTNDFRSLLNRVVWKIDGDDLDHLEPIQTKPTRDTRDTLRQVDTIVHQVMRQLGVIRDIEQLPIILLPVGSPGQRSIVLRPLITRTHMTVQAMLPDMHLPAEFFDTCAQRILREVDGISHVFLDLTNKPPATTEWE